ncbi:MAG: hypothetical protein JNM48_03615 [Rhodospirillales bacterium]|nr:hypothetical protein [Rhodospirillales bacterium]
MTTPRRFFRLLPALLMAAVLLLGVKTHEIFRALGGETAPSAISPAYAETPLAAPAQASPSAAHREDPASQHRPATMPPAPSASPAAAAPLPQLPSTEEMQVLQQLSARRQALDARAEELERRADLLRAGEARLDQKLREMQDVEAVLQGLLKTQGAQQEAQIRSLVKIYENMKPRDAARIFEELEMPTLLQVVERMSERKLAPVMADMNPAKARKVTEELARQRQFTRPVGRG